MRLVFRHVTPRLVATAVATLFLIQLVAVAGASHPQLHLKPSAACTSNAQCQAFFGASYTCDFASGYCVTYGGGGSYGCSSNAQCQAAFGSGYSCDFYSGYCVYYGGGGGGYGCSTNAQCQATYGPGYSCDYYSGSCVYSGGYGGCQEGAVNVIDNCPNGSWKTRQVCKNGAWSQENTGLPTMH